MNDQTQPLPVKKHNKVLIILLISIPFIILTGVIIILLLNTNNTKGDGDLYPLSSPLPSTKVPLLEGIDLPYYFIAVHNEPYHDDPLSGRKIADAYVILRRMIEKADQYDIKLTLMFTAQWAEYIDSDPELLSEVSSWEQNGHEIAGHHHSEYHNGWDGYAALPQVEIDRLRLSKAGMVETKVGDLDDYITALKKINININSGCMNDEQDKRVIPNEIIYDSCSGFFNYGTVGERRADGLDVKVGMNEYILKGKVNDIDRFWLSHYIVRNESKALDVMSTMDTMDPYYVYGIIVHSNSEQEKALDRLLELIHNKDDKALKNRTMTSIISEELLPIEFLDEETLNTQYDIGGSKPDAILPKELCGDGICNEIENRNSSLCPEDCS